MKTKILVIFLILLTSFSSCIYTANAEPIPFLQPLIKNIRKQLPKGLIVRLPSYFPVLPIKLYPYIKSDNSSFIVKIAFKPNCSSCIIGAITAVRQEKAKNFPPKYIKTTKIDLSNRIRGEYFTDGNDENKIRFISWNQDGQKFTIAMLAEAASQKELIDIAKSTMNASPIKSDN